MYHELTLFAFLVSQQIASLELDLPALPHPFFSGYPRLMSPVTSSRFFVKIVRGYFFSFVIFFCFLFSATISQLLFNDFLLKCRRVFYFISLQDILYRFHLVHGEGGRKKFILQCFVAFFLLCFAFLLQLSFFFVYLFL